jgi:hypothetical protein
MMMADDEPLKNGREKKKHGEGETMKNISSFLLIFSIFPFFHFFSLITGNRAYVMSQKGNFFEPQHDFELMLLTIHK